MFKLNALFIVLSGLVFPSVYISHKYIENIYYGYQRKGTTNKPPTNSQSGQNTNHNVEVNVHHPRSRYYAGGRGMELPQSMDDRLREREQRIQKLQAKRRQEKFSQANQDNYHVTYSSDGKRTFVYNGNNNNHYHHQRPNTQIVNSPSFGRNGPSFERSSFSVNNAYSINTLSRGGRVIHQHPYQEEEEEYSRPKTRFTFQAGVPQQNQPQSQHHSQPQSQHKEVVPNLRYNHHTHEGERECKESGICKPGLCGFNRNINKWECVFNIQSGGICDRNSQCISKFCNPSTERCQ